MLRVTLTRYINPTDSVAAVDWAVSVTSTTATSRRLAPPTAAVPVTPREPPEVSRVPLGRCETTRHRMPENSCVLRGELYPAIAVPHELSVRTGVRVCVGGVIS